MSDKPNINDYVKALDKLAAMTNERDDYKARYLIVDGLRIANAGLLETAIRECDELRAEVERLKADNTKLLFRCYNAGYMNGHHCTVEGGFTDIHHADMETYHAEEVAEIVAAMKGDA